MKKLLIFLPFLMVLLSGCMTTIVIDAGTLNNVYLMGKAKIGEPIVGGTIRVYDLDNNLLKEASNETYKRVRLSFFLIRFLLISGLK
jgi:hypothetical protein